MNKKLLNSLFLLASFGGLIGCSSDTIVSRPSWIDDKIIENAGDKDNKMKNIYDAIKALGDTNSKILDRVLYDIAQKNLGTLDELRKYSYDTTGISEFVASHPIYKSEDKGVKKVGDKAEITDLSDAEKNIVSQGKIKAQFDAIIESVHEKLFNEIKGGSYSTSEDKLFREQYFIDYLKKNLYTVDVTGVVPVKDKIFYPKTKDQTWVEYVNFKVDGGKESGFVNLYDESKKEFKGIYKDYVERNYLPSIYRTLLVENYVREQRYSNLGRSYARKVNMVSIPRDSKYAVNTLLMLQYFAKTYITERTEDVETDFEYINQALIGFAGVPQSHEQSNKAYQLLNYTVENAGEEFANRKNYIPVYVKNSSGDEVPFIWNILSEDPNDPSVTTGQDTYVYQGTKLGELVNKYLKIFDVTCTGTPKKSTDFTITPKKTLDSDAQSAYNDITNNGALPFDTGLYYKERDIRLSDITQDGWYLKNGGLTDLPSDYRDHLFNIETSNIVDNPSKEFTPGDYVGYYGPKNSRKAYLLESIVDTSKPWNAVVLNDKKSNFYILEIEDAVSTSKMSTSINNENSYLYKKATSNVTDSAIEMNKIVREVVKQNASGDTYKSNAEQYYIMLSNIVFYDQSAYDYFKSQFPDLFK